MWLLSELNDAFLRSQVERPAHPNYNHGPYQHCNDKCVASYQKNILTSRGEHPQQRISKTWVFWSKHVSEICFKAKKIIGLIYRQYYQHSNTDTLKQLCISSVWPHLEHAAALWDPHLQKDVNKLEKVNSTPFFFMQKQGHSHC